jgi:hypothetical protein
MTYSWMALVVLVAACGSSGGVTLDAGAIDSGSSELVRTYRRVIPGYDDVETCRAQNPDPIFHCTEIIDLCPDGLIVVLFTDILTNGTWSASTDGTEVVALVQGEPAFTQDGQVVLAVGQDGSLYSDEVYGQKAFVPSTDPLESLCQP